MADFDPERFEEEKYVDYFTELQQAYKSAFDVMNDRYDSQLVHGIDQFVLNESEPVYEDGDFRIELPEGPYDRLQGVMVSEEKFDGVLERYLEELRTALRREFGVEDA